MPYAELGRGGAHAVIAVDDAEGGAPRRLRPRAYRVRLAAPWSHADVSGLARHIEALRPVLGAQYVALAQPVQLSTLAVENALNTAVPGTRPSSLSCSRPSAQGTEYPYEWALEVPNLMCLWLPCAVGISPRSSPNLGHPAVVTVEIKPKAAAAVAARSLLTGLSNVTVVECRKSRSHLNYDCSSGCDGKSYWFDPQYDVKFHASRFAITQVHKARMRMAKFQRSKSSFDSCTCANERSRYEPADLFLTGFEASAGSSASSCRRESNKSSEDAEGEREQHRKRRARQALGALLERPENNFLVYVRGQRLDWSSPEGMAETQATLQAALLLDTTYESADCKPGTSHGTIEGPQASPESPKKIGPSLLPPALTWLAEVVARVLLADGADCSGDECSCGTCNQRPGGCEISASINGQDAGQGKGALGALATMQMRDIVDVEGAALLLRRLMELRGYSEADARAEIDALLLFNSSHSRLGGTSDGLYEEKTIDYSERCAEAGCTSSSFVEAPPLCHILPPPPSAADAAALQWPPVGKSVSNHEANNTSSNDDLAHGKNRIDKNGSGTLNGLSEGDNCNSPCNDQSNSSTPSSSCSGRDVPDASSRAAALSYLLAINDPRHVAQLLANWLLALAASDASLMLSFSAAIRSSASQHDDAEHAHSRITSPTEAEAGFLPRSPGDRMLLSSVGGLAYCIGMTDVGPKPSSKIEARALKEAEFCALAASSL